MLRAAALLILAAVTTLAATAGREAAMSDYRWKKRPLVVIAPDATAKALADQRAAVAADRAGYAERDMVVVWVVGDAVSAELGRSPGVSASALRSRYGVGPSAFRALLIGKDGGVKLSSSTPIATRALFQTIDAMPMRADEMRRR